MQANLRADSPFDPSISKPLRRANSRCAHKPWEWLFHMTIRQQRGKEFLLQLRLWLLAVRERGRGGTHLLRAAVRKEGRREGNGIHQPHLPPLFLPLPPSPAPFWFGRTARPCVQFSCSSSSIPPSPPSPNSISQGGSSRMISLTKRGCDSCPPMSTQPVQSSVDPNENCVEFFTFRKLSENL